MDEDMGLSLEYHNSNATINYTLSVTSISSMEDVSNLTFSNRTTADHTMNILKKITGIVSPVLILALMVCVGTTIEVKPLFQNLRRPLGPLVGMICQFVLLPASAFGLSHALQLDDLAAIGLLVIACCPGGSISNVATYWVDGDVSLSLTMTSLSTLLAVGMMPLNLWIYCRSWTTGRVVIPYVTIIISLVMIVIPASIGIFIRWKWERLGMKITKLATVFGVLAVIITIGSTIIFYYTLLDGSWNIYLGAVLFPNLGLIFGYLLAKICRMDNMQARAVSLETGAQNLPLALVLINVSFPSNIPQVAAIPTIYAFIIIGEIVLSACLYQLYKRSFDRLANERFEAVATSEK